MVEEREHTKRPRRKYLPRELRPNLVAPAMVAPDCIVLLGCEHYSQQAMISTAWIYGYDGDRGDEASISGSNFHSFLATTALTYLGHVETSVAVSHPRSAQLES